MNLPVKRLHPDAQLPTRGTPESAGLDLYAYERIATISPGKRLLIKTGVSVAIPDGHVGLIWPRSGIAVKHGLDVLAGVIDADYRGEIRVALINHGNEAVRICRGSRVAQLLIKPVAMLTPVDAEELPDTERGAGGFGSTEK